MSTQPRFRPLADGTGLDVIDPIETRHFSLFTGGSVAPAEADPDRFEFPVTTACRIRTDRIGLSYLVPVDVRTPDGDHLASVDLPASEEFAEGEYLLELHSPIKLYLRVSAGVAVEATDDGVEIRFDGEATVEVGARSYHESPAATVTVPDDPEAVMAAVSTFPSALQTTSPERAWPTLRGHPPRIERGEELSIPDGLETPDTGVTIAVPPEYGHVYTVAPLAYYLGAEVVPGGTARLTTDAGVSRHLGDDVSAVGESVESLLKRVFFLDCVTRTEGLYPTDLHEREVLESRGDIDLDFAALYDAPPAERLAAYLSVSDEAVAAVESPWHRVTHVESDPGPEAAELLPYVVNDLSLVRVKEVGDDEWSPSESQKQTGEALSAFVRSPSPTAGNRGEDPASADDPDPATAGGTPASDGDFLRSASADRGGDFRRSADDRLPVRRCDGLEGPDDGVNSGGDDSGRDAGQAEPAAGTDPSPETDPGRNDARGVPGEGGYIPLPETDALEQAWIGERTPVEGTKLLRQAFEHDDGASEDGTVEITAVCNDEEMRAELESAAEIYGDRDDLRTEVTCEFGVTTDELRDLLAEDSDMFHFIGHIDGLGFQCPDGLLDAETLDRTGATTVLLNGCRSHDQGEALVAAGASAAVVSLGDLWNEGAVEVGETLARLFHHGFSIGHAMTLVREHTSLGRDYVVLGDPGVTLAQCENLLPPIFHVDRSVDEGDLDPDEISVEAYSYPIRSYSIGSTTQMVFSEIEQRHIAVGGGVERRITLDKFRRMFENHLEPLIVDGELTWGKNWSGL